MTSPRVTCECRSARDREQGRLRSVHREAPAHIRYARYCLVPPSGTRLRLRVMRTLARGGAEAGMGGVLVIDDDEDLLGALSDLIAALSQRPCLTMRSLAELV